MKALEKFNGTLTLTNQATGEHRTFRIKTQPQDSKFAPGERIVSLLTGSDNTKDYTGFGFLKTGPVINLYRKKQTPTFEYYQKLLLAIEEGTDSVTLGTHTYGIDFSTRCRRCNRELTTPESIKSGIGPRCKDL